MTAGLAVFGLLGLWRVAEAETTFRQIYVGEIGHFGHPYEQQTTVEAVGLTMSKFGDDSVVIRGKDDAGKLWEVIVGVSGGVGFTEVWHGDLDSNGRADLIVLGHFPKSGGCGGTSELRTVMIDTRGRPVPWQIHSEIDLRRALHERFTDVALPPIPPPGVFEFVDLNGNGRAEFVQIECFDGETSIRAVYEVDDARWRRVDASSQNRSNLDYSRALRYLKYPPIPEPSEPYFVAEVSNVLDETKPVMISERIPRQGKCWAISVPAPVNGSIPSDPAAWEAAEERNYQACNDRFVLEDGRTCFGYPAVVIDRPNGRESQLVWKSVEATALLDEVIEKRMPVRLTGQTDEDHCSPAVIWAVDE